MIYRVKQFIWALTAKITEEDILFVEKYLDSEELKLFNKLSTMNKKHSIKVAVDIKNVCVDKNLNSKRLIKAGLLHDIGKTIYNINILEKSILVILDKLTKGKLKKITKVKSVNIYYNHGELGYNILRKYNYDQSFLDLIKFHHNNDIIENEELRILKKCDNNN